MKAIIISNKEVSPGYFLLKVRLAGMKGEPLPGQFAMIRVFDGGDDPILRRPMSIYNASPDGLEILYALVGKGTKILSKKVKGEEIDILSPLGNGFNVTDNISKFIFVGGGVGIAPFIYFAKYLKNKLKRDAVVFIGGKSAKDILGKDEFERLGCLVHISTEDGSIGTTGLITDILDRYLNETLVSYSSPPHSSPLPRGYNNPLSPFVKGESTPLSSPLIKGESKGVVSLYTCGPNKMMQAVGIIADRYKLGCQVSLDERMACGIGVCMGCVVKITGSGGKVSHKCTCSEGPVFDARDVVWGTAVHLPQRHGDTEKIREF